VAVLLLAISAGVLIAVRAWLPAVRWTSRV
jgi:hypothetical protein